MKLILTENQIKNLVNKLKTPRQVNEGSIGTEEYSEEVKIDVEAYGVKINGESIDWVTSPNVRLTYNISIEQSSWGINGIYVDNIKGPSEIEMEITPDVYNEESYRVEPIYLNLQYDWDNVQIEEERGKIIGVDNEIKVKLKNTENGDVVIDYISVMVYTL